METKPEKERKRILPSSTAACVMFIIMLAMEAAFIAVMMLMDILPGKYVALGLMLLLAIDAGTLLLLRGRKKGMLACGFVLAVLSCIILCIGTVYMYDTYQTLKKISEFNENFEKHKITEPFNVYITGIDMWGEIDQVSRSDVNMIVTVNPREKTMLLTSIPRDSYVVLHSFGEYDKLTHTGVWGVEETTATVEDWLGVDINYYVRVDFSMLVDIVNAIGGIDVYSDYKFKSAISKYKYNKGWNHLNGKAALYFARERKAFEDEDQQRIKDQQKVMKACLKKVTESTTLLTSYTKLLAAVEDEMETNMSEEEMADLVKMQLEDMRGWKITCQSIQGDLTMKGTYTMGMGRDLLVSIPREESVEEIKQGIKEAMKTKDTSEDTEFIFDAD